MTENNKNIFYVYVYMDPTKLGTYVYDNLVLEYEPFYIGKGKCGRYKMHINDAKWRKLSGKRKLSHMHNKILKIENPIIKKIKENMLEDEAFELEKKYIALIGRHDMGKGPLCNMSDGGDGQSGRIPWNKNKTGFITCNKNPTKEIDVRIDIYSNKLRGKKQPAKPLGWKPTQKQLDASTNIIKKVNRKRKELGLGSGFKGKTFSPEIKKMITDTWLQKRGHNIKVYYFIKNDKLLLIRGLDKYAKSLKISGGNMSKLFCGKLKSPYYEHTIINKNDLVKWKNNFIIIDYYEDSLGKLDFDLAIKNLK